MQLICLKKPLLKGGGFFVGRFAGSTGQNASINKKSPGRRRLNIPYGVKSCLYIYYLKLLFMKLFFSGKVLFSLLAPAVLLFSFMSFADRADFSGNWKLNEGKSELGDFAARVNRTVKVEQKDADITISTTRPGFNGGDDVTTTTTMTFDGKVTESEGFGGSKRKTSVKWSDDGKTLTVSSVMQFERDGQTSEFKSTETWTMSGAALSIVTNSTSPRGESTTKAIYEK